MTRLKKTVPFLILILVYAVFFNKTLLGTEFFVTPDFGTSDALYGELSNKLFSSESLKKLHWPSWEPYHATGYPLGAVPSGIQNPIFLLIYYFFTMPLAHNISLFVIFMIAGFSTFLYLKQLGITSSSALIGAVSFSLSGVFVAQLPHITMIETLCFLPLQFYIIEISLSKKKLWLGSLLPFTVGLQTLSGSPQISLYSLIFLFIYTVFRVFFSGIEGHLKKRFACVFILGIFLGFVMGAFILLPARNYTVISSREHGVSVDDVKMFPYPLIHFVNFLWPYLLGDPRFGTYPRFSPRWGIFWENTGYIGVLPLVFVFISIFTLFRKSKTVTYYVFALLLCILLMLGFHSPTFFLYLFPPLSLFRVPARWIMFLVFSLSVLASLGYEQFKNRLKNILAQSSISIFSIDATILTVVIVNLIAFALPYHLRGSTVEWFKEPQTVQYLKKDQSKYRIQTLGNQYTWNKQFINKGWYGAEKKFLTFNEALMPDWNMVFGIEHADSYSVLLSQRYLVAASIYDTGVQFDQNSFTINNPADKILALQNVKYIISPFEIINADMKKVFTTDTDPSYFIYKNISVLPRVFICSEYTTALTPQEYYKILISKNFNPTSTVILEKDIKKKFTKSSSSKVEIVKYEPQTVEISATMESEGIVILADSYHPGWKAYIDGTETDILPANINQRSVIVPEGKHIIKYQFQLDGLKSGAIITILSFILSLAITFNLFKYEKKHHQKNCSI